jgi:threonine dehydrogenase-like Zn-dependent dehydrogenase
MGRIGRTVAVVADEDVRKVRPSPPAFMWIVDITDEKLELARELGADIVIDARIEGDTIILPDALPEGCAYYCGARAAMTGATFEKVADTPEAALRATDLVGDPLCAGAP